MQRIKDYLNEINVPFEENTADGMTVLKLTYGGDMIAIFPPDDGEEEFHVVTAYDGKVQQYGKRDVEGLKNWLHAVFIEKSPDYVYADEKPKVYN